MWTSLSHANGIYLPVWVYSIIKWAAATAILAPGLLYIILTSEGRRLFGQLIPTFIILAIFIPAIYFISVTIARRRYKRWLVRMELRFLESGLDRQN
jgi:hypothetical protein